MHLLLPSLAQSLLIDGGAGAAKIIAQATCRREKVKPQVPFLSADLAG